MTGNAPALAGVIGSPISHSLSPRVHGYWLRKYGIGGYYIPVEIAPGALRDGLEALRRLGFRGVNVTLPHKEEAFALADEASSVARRIGAANTLTFDVQRGVLADNTDGYGFLQNLHEQAPHWRASAGPAVVLGAGGAARAVVDALLSDGAPEIRLVNRTRARAEALADRFGGKAEIVDWEARGDCLEGAATLVNTTSLGMAGHDVLGLDLAALPGAALVTDLVYRPLETELLKRARARGNPGADGLGMLLHQAVPGFERWFGRCPEVDQAVRETVLAP
ncbi:MAG: shikimate dehydrogenase [Paracoccaceae bacterium]